MLTFEQFLLNTAEKGGSLDTLFEAGERARPPQLLPNAPLRPERLSVHGVEAAVIPGRDLIAMKLST
jgi:hypothetical protein